MRRTDIQRSAAQRRAVTRRTVLSSTAGALLGTTATSSIATGQEGTPSFDGWFDKTENYDGVVDRTESSEVTVTVGPADVDGGPYAFEPAAVRVDPGTTVVWKWTGEGGSHNVVDEEGRFESELVSDSGHTFSHTFDDEGVYRYYCSPHKGMGMVGAVVVGDVRSGAGLERTLAAQVPAAMRLSAGVSRPSSR